MSEEDAVVSVVAPVVAVVLAAIAVCVGVRFFNRPRKPGWRFWLAASLIVAVVYPLSYGPALLFMNSFKIPAMLGNCFTSFYEPLHWIAGISQPTLDLYFWYSSLWVTPGPHIVQP